MRPWFRDLFQRVFLPGPACPVQPRFRRRQEQRLRVEEHHHGRLLFLRLRAAAVPHQGREAVSHRGEAAVEVAAVQRARRLDRRGTRRLRVAAEADIRTDARQLCKNHSRVPYHRVPVAVHIAGSRITHDFAALRAELFHRREHHHCGPQSAHGNFLLAADFE
jgi:hypothetical protein